MEFHQDIGVNKKEAKAIVHAHSTCATAAPPSKSIQLFIIWLQLPEEKILNGKYATFEQKIFQKILKH